MIRRAAMIAAMVAAGPAWAQDAPSCGGIGTVGDWVGGDAAASDLSRTDAVLDADGAVPVAGHLVRLFALSEPGTVRVDVAAIRDADPYVTLYDAAGDPVADDDDSGDGFAARLVADLEPGSYCLAVRSYDLGVADVSVRIGAAALFGDDAATEAADDGAGLPAPEPTGGCDALDVARLGDGPLAADALGRGASATASAASRPAYLFDLAVPTPLTVTARSDDGDPLIRLRDGAGTLLAQDDDTDGLNSRIDRATPLEPGLYCVEVEDLRDGEAPITVSVVTFDPVSDRLARIGALELAPAATDAVTVRELGSLETALTAAMDAGTTARWFGFDLRDGGLILVEAVAMGGDGDPTVALFDRIGRPLGFNDDGPAGLDSLLVHRAVAGRYLLGVRTLAEGPGEIRVLLERFLPAGP